MWRTISDTILLSQYVPADKAALLEHFREKEIYDWTFRIPFPYGEKDADDFLSLVEKQTREIGQPVNWAVREKDGRLIGGVGFIDAGADESTESELGYWLAKPYWGRGIMTLVVKKVCEIGFAELSLDRITATVFDGNGRSVRVLEKAGFTLEKTLRDHYKKDGRTLDGKRYARQYQER